MNISVRKWIRYGFFTWALLSTTWLLNGYRTRGVDPSLLVSNPTLTVQSSRDALAFLPTAPARPTGLLFIVGAGVAAEAYAPLLRPVAERGHPVFVVRLPYRIAPLERHRQAAVAQAEAIVKDHPTVTRWVVAGHSLGGALACRIAANPPNGIGAFVLIGTTHPTAIDLSRSRIPITKIYGSRDGVAPVEKIEANRALLPRDTPMIEIEGGNHSQFAHYGYQLFDGSPTVSREEQQRQTRAVLLRALEPTR